MNNYAKTMETIRLQQRRRIIKENVLVITILLVAICAIFGIKAASINDADTTTTSPTPTVITHIVMDNDSWWKLSKIYYGEHSYYEALARYNNQRSNDPLHTGSKIKIPSIDDGVFKNIIEDIRIKNKKEVETYNQTMSGKTILAAENEETWYYTRFNHPAVDITVPDYKGSMKNNTQKIDTTNFMYIGAYRITGYTPHCEHCCESSSGIGSAGTRITCGYSIAATWDFPYGTTLYIEGYGFYVVEDRGNLEDETFDIACPTHEQCEEITKLGVNVYIVPQYKKGE